MDVSLDDFISKNKISTRGRGGSRGRGRGRGGPTRGGRVMKRTAPVNARGNARSFPSVRGRGGALRTANGASGGSGKLTISNLDFGVSDNDIRELFSEFGRLLKASVHYDRSGRSLGLAEVLFQNRSDALKARNQYNGVPLDGRAMSIQLEGAANGAAAGAANGRVVQARRGANSNVASSRGNSRGARGNARGAGRGRGRGGFKVKGPPPTKEDLDAELDKYISKVEQITAE